MLTAHQAKCIVYELKARHADKSDRIIGEFLDAGLDFNPHQIEAALFALRSPFSQGVLLADEFGLGKSIEAGLVISQYVHEHRPRILVLCPTTLQKHWENILGNSFHLDVAIHFNRKDASSFSDGKVIIISYSSALKIAERISQTDWDLVVLDEAHRLCNSRRPDNPTARILRNALAGKKKILLSTVPIQRSLLDLFLLARLLDDHIFPDEHVFRKNYIGAKRPNFDELRERIKPYFFRTLREHVGEYIPLPNRTSVTLNYRFSPEQKQLIEELNDYFENETRSYSGDRSIISALHKAASSSNSALVGFLFALQERSTKHNETPNESIQRFIRMALSLSDDPKAMILADNLGSILDKLEKTGANRKALIFTESVQTQNFLRMLLEVSGFSRKVVTFNGQNNDPDSRAIYRKWKRNNRTKKRPSGFATVDRRQAILDHFESEAEIMIATDTLSEGLNLQFCSLVVNYDLPWNPVQIERRIGRCHRYGQKNDVTVINFLNLGSEIDTRIYDLLHERLQLFDGVFGSSAESLGQMESGHRLEKKISKIIGKCRAPDEIDKAFKKLHQELDEPARSRIAQAKHALFEHFDENIISRFRVRLYDSYTHLNRTTRIFWRLIRSHYRNEYEFDETDYTFRSIDGKRQYYLNTAPRPETVEEYPTPAQRRKQFRNRTGIQPYRLHGMEAEILFNSILRTETVPTKIRFAQSVTRKIETNFQSGNHGWLRVDILTIFGFDKTEELLYSICDGAGKILPPEYGRDLITWHGVTDNDSYIPSPYTDRLECHCLREKERVLDEYKRHAESCFHEESTKLDRWASDLRERSGTGIGTPEP